MKWLRRLRTWWIERQNNKERLQADLDMLIYGCKFVRVYPNGKIKRISPEKFYSTKRQKGK